MISILYFALLGLLLIIAYEDFKERLIHWYWLPLIYTNCIVISIFSPKLTFALIDQLFIFLFIAVIILTLFAYLRLSRQKKINLFKDYLGIGDVLFFIAISPLFSFATFLVFFIISLTFVSFCFLLFRSLTIIKDVTIPLAGGMSISLILLLIIVWIFEIDNYNAIINKLIIEYYY